MPETERTGHAPRTDSEGSRDQKATLLRTQYVIREGPATAFRTLDAAFAERRSREGARVTARTEAIEG